MGEGREGRGGEGDASKRKRREERCRAGEEKGEERREGGLKFELLLAECECRFNQAGGLWGQTACGQSPCV